MHIFIDESGVFANPQSEPTALSCVGTLSILDVHVEKVFDKFDRLKRQWGISGEIKANSYLEKQTDEIFRMLRRYSAIFEVAVLDLGITPPATLDAHRAQQLENLDRLADSGSRQSFKKSVYELKERVEKLSQPLYAQMVVQTVAITKVIENVGMYFSQRMPKELGDFHWIIDAKDKQRTEYEDLWTEMVMPFLQAHTIAKPFAIFDEGDYSYFDRFNYKKLPDELKDVASKKAPSTNIRMLMSESRKFVDSEIEPGIQLVDICTSTLRRALKGNFKPLGYAQLGSLMIRRKNGAITLCDFGTSPDSNETYFVKVPYFEVLKNLRKNNRSMLLPKYYKAALQQDERTGPRQRTN